MRVHIIGPNLPDQSNGSFHVHAEGCADVKRSPLYRGPDFASDRRHTFDVASLVDIVEQTMPDQVAEEGDGFDPLSWIDDFHILPCVGNLPDRTPED